MGGWAADHLRTVLERASGPVPGDTLYAHSGLPMGDYRNALGELQEEGAVRESAEGDGWVLREEPALTDGSVFTEVPEEQPTEVMEAVPETAPSHGFRSTFSLDGREFQEIVQAYLAVRLEDADDAATAGQLREEAKEFAEIAPKVWERLRHG